MYYYEREYDVTSLLTLIILTKKFVIKFNYSAIILNEQQLTNN